jgi:diacylglycerol O-acyltransferase / wax synthase
MAEHLTALDATFLELEQSDETAHMHIGALLVFEPLPGGGTPSFEEGLKHLEERVNALPRYSQRLSELHTGGLSWPSWEPDEQFDIRNHVHRAALPAPGGEQELLDWAGDYWSHRLDRRRPLWDAVLLEGLEGGCWAICTKTHHCLVDGVGSLDIGYVLLDTTPEPSGEWLAHAPSAHPGKARAGAWNLPALVMRGTRSSLDVALHPKRVLDLFEHSKALAELILRDEVVAAPASSLNNPIGTERRFAIVRSPLADVKAVKTALGGTVNDVVLASVTGGLRRLLLGRGEEPPEHGLRAMVPVNVRPDREQLALGNRISSLFVQLPVVEPEALQRYRLICGESKSLKSGNAGIGAATLLEITGLAPPVMHSVLARSLFASRLFNVTVTNVPGPQIPLYALGARLREIYPLVPIAAEHAVGIAVISYDGQLVFGVHADRDTVPDVDVLVKGIHESLAELKKLAAAERRAHRPKPRARALPS